jgi:outer membrane immunogenic protein
MKNLLLGTAMVSAAFAGSVGSVGAATLDDVMARLDSLQRDNQAMRKEIATLRQNNAQATRQAAVPANAPSRSLPPNVSTAMAADLPASRGYYKATPVEGPYNWTGVYAGANAGYAFGDETSIQRNLVPPVGLQVADQASYDGFAGGLQIGYNYQIGQLVFGIEADAQAASIGDRFHGVNNGALFVSNRLDTFGTVRGRVGYTFDRFMPYVTGGFAVGRNTFTVQALGIQDSAIHTGWTAGGGIEYGFRDNWTVKAEYLHVDLSEQQYLNGTFGNVFGLFSNMKYDFVRAGVNYRF